MTMTGTPQHLAALGLANAITTDRRRLRREVEGRWALASDLIAEPNDYPALKTCPVVKVLAWQPRWGEATARRFLAGLGISELTVVGPVQPGGLTMRQRIAVVEALKAKNR